MKKSGKQQKTKASRGEQVARSGNERSEKAAFVEASMKTYNSRPGTLLDGIDIEATMITVCLIVMTFAVLYGVYLSGSENREIVYGDDPLAENSAYAVLTECFVKTGSGYAAEYGDTLTDQEMNLHLFDFDEMVDRFYREVEKSAVVEETDRGALKYTYRFKVESYEVDLVTAVYEDSLTSEIQVYCSTGAYHSKRKSAALNTENFVVNAKAAGARNSVTGAFMIERETFIDFLNLIQSGNLVNTEEKPFEGLKILHDYYPESGGFEEDIY